MTPLQEKRLLKFAAKAVKGEFSPGNSKRRIGPTWRQWKWEGPQGIYLNGNTYFPSMNTAHAIHLAAALSMDIFFNQISVVVEWETVRTREECSGNTEDRERAARWAILKTAAIIGRKFR